MPDAAFYFWADVGGADAAVGGEVGQALVVEFEQDPSRDVMSVGGQRADPELAVAVKAGAGGVELGEQAGEGFGQLGIPAFLVLAAGIVHGGG